jgi:hypothetical protein
MTYEEFLNSDFGTQLIAFLNEMIENDDFVLQHRKVIEEHTNIINDNLDNTLYEIYDTVLNFEESLVDDVDNYFDELDRDVEDGVYED